MLICQHVRALYSITAMCARDSVRRATGAMCAKAFARISKFLGVASVIYNGTLTVNAIMHVCPRVNGVL
jgi:hypothetical protein